MTCRFSFTWEPRTALPPGTRLARIHDRQKDGVRDSYLGPSVAWASVTPVILPGHDDRKPEKTRSLIRKALQQSGVEQHCQFEWSAFSHFRQMLSAHKYRKDPNDPSKKMGINYIRPDHLLDQTAVHLSLTFENGVQCPGPLTIGAGRHCGFGVMAAIGSSVDRSRGEHPIETWRRELARVYRQSAGRSIVRPANSGMAKRSSRSPVTDSV